MSDDSSPDKEAEDLAIENEDVVSNSSQQKPAHLTSGEQLNFNFIAYEEKTEQCSKVWNA